MNMRLLHYDAPSGSVSTEPFVEICERNNLQHTGWCTPDIQKQMFMTGGSPGSGLETCEAQLLQKITDKSVTSRVILLWSSCLEGRRRSDQTMKQRIVWKTIRCHLRENVSLGDLLYVIGHNMEVHCCHVFTSKALCYYKKNIPLLRGTHLVTTYHNNAFLLVTRCFS